MVVIACTRTHYNACLFQSTVVCLETTILRADNNYMSDGTKRVWYQSNFIDRPTSNWYHSF